MVSRSLGLLLGVLLLSGCSNSSTPLHPEQNAPPTEALNSLSPFGLFEARLGVSPEGPRAELAPLAPERALGAIGDLYTVEVGDYFTFNPCADCFAIVGVGLSVDGDLQVDLAMRHPFDSTALRADLDVFDPRVIVLLDQELTGYPALSDTYAGSDGTQREDPALQPDLFPFADGYTAHFDWIAEEPALVGTPRNYDGSLNPYFDFFTEDDPDPLLEGSPIPAHRMAMAGTTDVQRVAIDKDALAARGNQIQALLVIEVGYGASAIRAIPPGQPGSRSNPAYYLPAFNRKEAVRVSINAPASYIEGNLNEQHNVDIAVVDWQAELSGVGPANFAQGPAYGDRGEIPYTSTLTRVSLSVPALDSQLKESTVFPFGSGTFLDPWTITFGVRNTQDPPAGRYYGLLAVEDSYHGVYALPGLPLEGSPTSTREFRTFKVVPFNVDPPVGGDDPPVAVFEGREVGSPTWTTAPGVIAITAGESVEYRLAGSSDDVGFGTPAAFYDLDGDTSYENTQNDVATIVSRLYASPGTLAISARVQDSIGQYSPVQTFSLDVQPPSPPTGFSTDPLPDFPIDCKEHSADTVGDNIYIMGGYHPTLGRLTYGYKFDPDDGAGTYTQTSVGIRGIGAGQGRESAEALALGTKIYVLGGTGTWLGSCGSFSPTEYYNPTDVYETTNNTWSTLNDLYPNLWRPAGAVYNGRLWLPGGFRERNETTCGAFTNSVNTTTVLNPSTNVWNNLNEFSQAIPAFTTRRWGHGTAVLHDKLYILPGYGETAGGTQGTTDTVQEYDLQTSGASWVSRDSIPQNRHLYEAEVVNDRAYVIAGVNGWGGPATNSVYQFDPTLAPGSQWSNLGALPYSARYGYASAVLNDQIYVFAGALTVSTYSRQCFKLTLN